MRRLLLIFIMFCSPAVAQNSLNLQLPGTTQSYQSDSFRTGEMNCSNAIGSATNLEFGVTGIIEAQRDDPFNLNNNLSGGRNVGVYARIVIPLGKVARKRINCNTLYELELQRKRIEIMKLEQEVQQLKALKFEGDK